MSRPKCQCIWGGICIRKELVYKRESRRGTRSDLRQAPTWRLTSSPFLKNSIVGIFITPYSSQVSGLSSTLSLPTTTRPSYSLLSSSTIGNIILQGPHQGAHKSTTRGLPSANNALILASVISIAIIVYLFCNCLIVIRFCCGCASSTSVSGSSR